MKKRNETLQDSNECITGQVVSYFVSAYNDGTYHIYQQSLFVNLSADENEYCATDSDEACEIDCVDSIDEIAEYYLGVSSAEELAQMYHSEGQIISCPIDWDTFEEEEKEEEKEEDEDDDDDDETFVY